jgi:class 3 adenylate cyclase
VEVDARADEYFGAFKQALPAVEAAVEIQHTVGSRSWPDDVVCKLRAGLHTGRPTLTKSGYIGLSVHTAARVCSAAHGGQILLSADTKAAVEASLPAGVRLRSLGRRRLPGLARPEALFQVEAEGLLDEFPRLRRAAVRTRPARPSPAARRTGASPRRSSRL